jgi:hypothetical protein
MVPVACVSTWLGSEYNKGIRQRAAIAWVKEIGGHIEFDDEATANDWRRRVFGKRVPRSVRRIVLDGLPVPIDIAPLAELESLRVLEISNMLLLDLAPLAQLQNLEELQLYNTEVTELAPLSTVENLHLLVLYRVRMNDLAPLANLQSLEELYILHTPVNDLTPLSTLGNLQVLMLNNTRVTDMVPLAELQSLEELYLYNEAVSDGQVQALREALPNCTVIRSLDPVEERRAIFEGFR